MKQPQDLEQDEYRYKRYFEYVFKISKWTKFNLFGCIIYQIVYIGAISTYWIYNWINRPQSNSNTAVSNGNLAEFYLANPGYLFNIVGSLLLLGVLIFGLNKYIEKTSQKLNKELLVLWCTHLIEKLMFTLIFDPFLIYQYEDRTIRNKWNFVGINIYNNLNKSTKKQNYIFAEYIRHPSKIKKFLIPFLLRQSPELANNKYFRKPQYQLWKVTIYILLVAILYFAFKVMAELGYFSRLTIINWMLLGLIGWSIARWIVWKISNAIVCNRSVTIIFQLMMITFFNDTEMRSYEELLSEKNSKKHSKELLDEYKIIETYIHPERFRISKLDTNLSVSVK